MGPRPGRLLGEQPERVALQRVGEEIADRGQPLVARGRGGACVTAAATAGCGSCSNSGWPGRSPPGQANSACKTDITPVGDLVGLQGTGGAPRDDDVPVLD